jgi:hypothetical protein
VIGLFLGWPLVAYSLVGTIIDFGYLVFFEGILIFIMGLRSVGGSVYGVLAPFWRNYVGLGYYWSEVVYRGLELKNYGSWKVGAYLSRLNPFPSELWKRFFWDGVCPRFNARCLEVGRGLREMFRWVCAVKPLVNVNDSTLFVDFLTLFQSFFLFLEEEYFWRPMGLVNCEGFRRYT